jgi:hypothetical protein
VFVAVQCKFAVSIAAGICRARFAARTIRQQLRGFAARLITGGSRLAGNAAEGFRKLRHRVVQTAPPVARTSEMLRKYTLPHRHGLPISVHYLMVNE